jgi:DNA repair photolyase
MLNRFKIQHLVVTKGAIVANDEYLSIYDSNLAHFQISITNTDDSLKTEKASLPSERIKAVERLYDLGFDVSVRLSPFIESQIDVNIVNSIKCNKILIEFLKVNHFIKKSFDIDYSEYSLKYGGHENLQLSKKIELVNKITGFEQISVGEYVVEHHEYFSSHVNYNPEDCCNLRLNKLATHEQLTLF